MEKTYFFSLNGVVSYVSLKVPWWGRGPSSFSVVIFGTQRLKAKKPRRNAFIRKLDVVFSFHLFRDHGD